MTKPTDMETYTRSLKVGNRVILSDNRTEQVVEVDPRSTAPVKISLGRGVCWFWANGHSMVDGFELRIVLPNDQHKARWLKLVAAWREKPIAVGDRVRVLPGHGFSKINEGNVVYAKSRNTQKESITRIGRERDGGPTDYGYTTGLVRVP